MPLQFCHRQGANTFLDVCTKTLFFLNKQDVAAYRAKGGSGKSDAGKKSGPGRPAAKKAEPADDDDDEEDDDDEDEDEDDDDEDDD